MQRARSSSLHSFPPHAFIHTLLSPPPSSPSFRSPVKFSAGDGWARSPLVAGVLRSPQEQAMELSTPEQMDVSSSSEASAPLPIRQPAGLSLAQMKQPAYPVAAKRPDHLRMNL